MLCKFCSGFVAPNDNIKTKFLEVMVLELKYPLRYHPNLFFILGWLDYFVWLVVDICGIYYYSYHCIVDQVR